MTQHTEWHGNGFRQQENYEISFFTKHFNKIMESYCRNNAIPCDGL